ncbi:hypothetical protein QYM36_001124 [Artemia franciscana]|uniref:Uncharacterized protein n=1 Tax=Artemia franciscana TaxID=6661 RepID=A0AA88ID94_ARTSF|nr:hypothetical protein QYM36_001124 [Artemia franciscana]
MLGKERAAGSPALTPSSRLPVSSAPRSRTTSEIATTSPLNCQQTESNYEQSNQRWRGIRNAFSRWRRHGLESRYSSPSSGVASDDSFGESPLSPSSVQSEIFPITCSSRTRIFAHPHRGPVVNPQANIYSRLPPIHSNKHFSFVRALRRRKLREKSKSDQDLHGSKLDIQPLSGNKDDSGLTVFATVRLPKDRRESPSIFSTFWNNRSQPRRCDTSFSASETSTLKEQESDGTQLTPVPLPRRASKDSRCGTPFLSFRPRSRSLERFSSARIFPSLSGLGSSNRSRSLERSQKFQTDRKDSLTQSFSGPLVQKKRSKSVENTCRVYPCDDLGIKRTNFSKFSNPQVSHWKTFSEVFASESSENLKRGPASSAIQDIITNHQVKPASLMNF